MGWREEISKSVEMRTVSYAITFTSGEVKQNYVNEKRTVEQHRFTQSLLATETPSFPTADEGARIVDPGSYVLSPSGTFKNWTYAYQVHGTWETDLSEYFSITATTTTTTT